MAGYYDVAVIGLGAMGSATAYHMARRNMNVLGLDQYAPPHDLGSSHGETRIIREAYFEHPSYVPIVQRAYELWRQLEAYSGKTLLLQTGGMMIGSPEGELVTGSEYSARHHHLPYERLYSSEVRDRYPAFNLPEDYIAIWDPRAGILMPETCVEVHLEAAQKNGADLRLNERATYWGVEGDHVVITTNLGEYRARFLVLAAGAWVSELLQDLRLPLTVERQVLCWFQPNAQQPMFAPDDFPIFIWERSQGDQFYGFPDLGNGVKVARMHHGETTNPNALRRDASEDDISSVRKFLRESIPAANGKCVSTQVCMFTNTPDTNFIIDFHPQHRNVLIASPCSGHGFKFSSAIGEIVTDLIVGDDSQYDLSLFRLDRFHN